MFQREYEGWNEDAGVLADDFEMFGSLSDFQETVIREAEELVNGDEEFTDDDFRMLGIFDELGS